MTRRFADRTKVTVEETNMASVAADVARKNAERRTELLVEFIQDQFDDGTRSDEYWNWLNSELRERLEDREDASEINRNFVKCEECGKIHDRRQSCAFAKARIINRLTSETGLYDALTKIEAIIAAPQMTPGDRTSAIGMVCRVALAKALGAAAIAELSRG